jgi:hypothetical protein
MLGAALRYLPARARAASLLRSAAPPQAAASAHELRVVKLDAARPILQACSPWATPWAQRSARHVEAME